MSTGVMRIITRLNIGGPARHVAILSRGLDAFAFDTELVSGSEAASEGRLEPGTRFTRVPALVRPVSPREDLRAARALEHLVRSRRPTIVHTHLAKAGTLGRMAAIRAHVPIVVHTYHGHVLDGYFSRPVAAAFLVAERALARRTDQFVAVSQTVRDELLGLGIGRPEQWRVVPLGLELEPFIRATTGRAEAREMLGLRESGAVVGFVGRLVPIKDVPTLLRSARRVAVDRPDLTVVVAGDGELRAELERTARTLLGERVRFLGWVHDLPTLYRALDVVVLTSRNEGTPVTLIEAAAAGRPAVATRVGGVGEVVRDGETGLLARPGDDSAIARLIGSLLDDRARAEALGSAARNWVRERYSADRLVGDMAALYDDLLRTKGISRA
jgi:glycosyltransferase involved in cell wall biosynthesis